MKSLIRGLSTIGLLTGMVLSAAIPAIALEAAEIESRLREVLVFTVTDSGGSPLVARVEGQSYAGVFIDPQDAEAFMARVASGKQELASQIKVTPVTLDEIYNLDRNQNASSGEEAIDFVYVPSSTDLQVARQLINDAENNFQGVPLFAVKIQNTGEGGNESTYLTLPRRTRNAAGEEVSENIVPFFFSQAEAQRLAQQYDNAQTEQGGTGVAQLEVHSLEVLLQNWEQRDEDALRYIWLVPSSEAIEYIRENAPQR
jgi:hypothetical protein